MKSVEAAIVEAVDSLGALRGAGYVIRDKAEEILRAANSDDLTSYFWDWVYENWNSLSGEFGRAAMKWRFEKDEDGYWNEELVRVGQPFLRDYIKRNTTVPMARVYQVRKIMQYNHRKVYDCRTHRDVPARNMLQPV